MARSIRIEYEGAYYHVMARGNRREAIFLDDEDRKGFLSTVGEACAMTGWRVHAWVLMSNHYHLMIETPEANLVAGMKWLQNTVTRRFNVRHRAWGRVFGDRYKAIVTEGKKAYYYETLMDYIHLNPVRAGLVRPHNGESLMDFPWSSLIAGYAHAPEKRAKWLAVESGLGVFGYADTVGGRRQMVERLDRRAVEEGFKDCGIPPSLAEIDARCSHLRRGWYWGTQAFGEQMTKLVKAAMVHQQSRAYQSAPERLGHGLEQAKKWLRDGLEIAGLSTADLERLPGSHPTKVALAALLWRRTTVSQGWLAAQLKMKSAANVSHLLRKAKSNGHLSPLPKELRRFLHAMEKE